MSGSVNKVMLVGRLGADPEIRRTQAGKPIANLRLATEKSWKDKNSGEKITKTEWHRVVIFAEGLADIVEKYFKKGDLISVFGSLQTRKWRDQQGQDRYSTEVVLNPYEGEATIIASAPGNKGGGDQRGEEDQGFDEDQQSRAATGSSTSAGGSGGARAQPGRREDMDDEIPFRYKDLDRFKP